MYMQADLYATTYYVNSVIGDDSYDGLWPTFLAGSTGPTQSITSALALANDGDTLQISGMFTTEPVINTKAIVFNFNNNTELGNLYIDCGTGVTVVQGADAYIRSSMVFDQGILNCIGNLFVFPAASAAAINPSSYAIGNFFIGKASTGLEKLIFSTGTETYARNFEWTLEQSTNDTNYYSVQMFNSETPSKLLPSGLNARSFVHYYLTKFTGNAVPSNFTYGLEYKNTGSDDEVSDPTNLRVISTKSAASAYTNLGGNGAGNPNGIISSTVTTNDTGIVTLANVIGGTNALGSKIPIVNFDAQNTCQNRATLFTDKTFISSSSGASINAWKWDFGTGNPSDTSNLQNPTFTYSTAGNYTVKLVSSASNGSKDSLSKLIYIGENPMVNYTVTSKCLLDSLTFNTTSAVPDGIANYEWHFGDGVKRIGNTNTEKYKYAIANNYTSKLIVTSNTGCKDSTNKSLTVFAAPAASALVNGNCTADSVVFEGLGGAIGDPITSWNWDINSNNNTNQNFKIKLNTSTGVVAKLVVTATSGCMDSISVFKAIWESPKAIIYLDNSVANNDSIQCFTNNFFTLLNASSYPSDQGFTAELLWGADRVSDDNDFSFTQSGKQDVVMKIVTDKGCEDSMVMSYATTIPENVTMSQQSKCLNDSVTLFALPNSIAASKIQGYRWQIGTQQYTSSIDTLRIKAADSGNYTAKMWILLNEGCTDTASVNYRLEPLPSIKADTIGNMPFCPGDSVTLDITGGTSILWNDGNTVYLRTFKTAGNYSFEVKDALGCIANATWTSSLFTPPIAAASNDTTINKGETITLFASGGTKYLWLPVGAVSDDDSAITTTTPLTTRTIAVIVTDTNGCKDTANVKITVATAGSLTNIMNLISPNGDGKNDVWDLSKISKINTAKITVFNTRGAKVWETTGYSNDWAGTDLSGKALPSDTYLYIIEKQNETPLKGYLQIIQK